jgi:hypothetical protein
MAAVIGSLRAELSASIAKFQDDMGKAAAELKKFQRQAEFTAKGIEAVGTRMTIALTAPLLLLGKDSVQAARQFNGAMAQVESALLSTNAASGKTADGLRKTADQLESVSAFSKGAILSNVTAQLLQFTNVFGPTFDRAQKAIIDMTARLGGGEGGLEGVALKVGRALQDPIQGIAALSRSGVTFTTAEKDLIKTLVQSGRGLEAQGIILDKLETKFHGAALAMREAQPDARFAQAWSGFKEVIGEIILQVLPKITDILTALINAFKALPEWAQKTLVWIAALAAAFGPLLLAIGSIIRLMPLLRFGWTALTIAIGPVLTVLGALWGWITAISAAVLGWVALLAGVVLAIYIFRDAIGKVLKGDFKDAWASAKKTALGIVADIKGIFKGGANDGINPVTITPGVGAPPSPNFDQHDQDILNARKTFLQQLQGVNDRIAHGLDAVNLPKSTTSANDLNRQLDDYIAAAKEAGVNTDAFSQSIAVLRSRIAGLEKEGLSKEAETFAREVTKSDIAVRAFADGGLKPLDEALAQIDEQYDSLKERIEAQIKDNDALAKENDVARAAMDRLKATLAGLEAAHTAASAAAIEQYQALLQLQKLEADENNLRTANSIRDLLVQSGKSNGPIGAVQQKLQDIGDQLKFEQIDAHKRLLETETSLAEARRKGDTDQIDYLTKELDLEKQYAELVDKTSAGQIEAADRIHQAFSDLVDSLENSLSDMIANWSFDLKGLMNIFRQLAEQLYIRPFVQSVTSGAGDFLENLAKGAVGLIGGAAISPVTITPGVDMSGTGYIAPTHHALGGSLNPGHWGIAGEHGPEPIWAGASKMQIMSNPEFSSMFDRGAGRQIIVNQNISTPDANSFRMSKRQVAREAKQVLSF